jgi:hypothetical protein
VFHAAGPVGEGDDRDGIPGQAVLAQRASAADDVVVRVRGQYRDPACRTPGDQDRCRTGVRRKQGFPDPAPESRGKKMAKPGSRHEASFVRRGEPRLPGDDPSDSSRKRLRPHAAARQVPDATARFETSGLRRVLYAPDRQERSCFSLRFSSLRDDVCRLFPVQWFFRFRRGSGRAGAVTPRACPGTFRTDIRSASPGQARGGGQRQGRSSSGIPCAG